MAVERAKVIKALDDKFKGKSVTKNFKEKLADKWAAKIETDEEIDDYISDREDVILEAMKDKDSSITAAVAKAKADAAAILNGDKKTEETTPEVPDGAPDWFKAYVSNQQTAIKALEGKLDGFQKERHTQSLADRFKTDERVKYIPDFIRNGYLPTTEEEFEAKVTALHTEYTKFATENKLQAFGGDAPAAGGTGGQQAAQAGKVDPDIVAFGKQQNAAVTQKN